MEKNKDIWSSFEYDPRFNSLTIVPEQKKVITLDTKNNIFYFDENPYGEKLNKRIENIIYDKTSKKIKLELKSKNINIKPKNKISEVLIDQLIFLNERKIHTLDEERDHIQITFLNDKLNKINLIKYSKENEVLLNLTLDTNINNDYFYIFFNGLKLLVDDIRLINNEILITTKLDTFKYLLNTQPIICDFIKQILKCTIYFNEKDTLIDIDKEQFSKVIDTAFNSDTSFLQIHYNTYYNHLFFMIDKNIFYLNISDNKLFYLSTSLPYMLVCLEKIEKNGSDYLFYYSNRVTIINDLEVNNKCNKIILDFLLDLNNYQINITNTINESFAFFIRDYRLNQLRFLKFDDSDFSVVDYFNLYTNNNKLTSKTKEMSINSATEFISLKDNFILIKTGKKDFYYQLNTSKLITSLLNELLVNVLNHNV